MFFGYVFFFFFFKQKTAYEMRISDWSSDVCSSDLDVDAQLTAGPDAVLLHDLREGKFAPGECPADVAQVVEDGLGRADGAAGEIGRASCRERVCQYV